jgi:hypothetical protein
MMELICDREIYICNTSPHPNPRIPLLNPVAGLGKKSGSLWEIREGSNGGRTPLGTASEPTIKAD